MPHLALTKRSHFKSKTLKGHFMLKIPIRQLENLLSENLRSRGLAHISLENELANTANDLNNSDTTMIVTGFCIKDYRIGETDGPLGTLSLAYALEQLGKKVVIVTDDYTKPLINVGIASLNLKAACLTVTEHFSQETFQKILDHYNPNHVIAIERPGRTKDGKSYSMRGEDITEYSPNTDLLFLIAKERGIRTSAIGDGGNEVGMGKISSTIEACVPFGKTICATLSTDNLIVAGVSNWGGYAISALLSMLNHKMLMYDASVEAMLLTQIVKAGAIDGLTKKRGLSVDGLSMKKNLDKFIAFKYISETYIHETT